MKCCESCEWLSEHEELPYCLLKHSNTGLLLCCDKYKLSTGNHVTF